MYLSFVFSNFECWSLVKYVLNVVNDIVFFDFDHCLWSAPPLIMLTISSTLHENEVLFLFGFGLTSMEFEGFMCLTVKKTNKHEPKIKIAPHKKNLV